jgi:hypothetical protein
MGIEKEREKNERTNVIKKDGNEKKHTFIILPPNMLRHI